ncbi:hypothetical protein [Thermosporothrix hazakensis]|jgi:predicted TIM-barrel fold metal-dependent hydrolase|nr:hypothetical protein [Thermosporothrix hazakensis]GCE45139.1 hypothetical protein KTH_00080 [Thermosporothrix hazakensis]
MDTIALEEHSVSPAFLQGSGRNLKEQAERCGSFRFLELLCDLDDRRIADMDAADIDMQVLSLGSPGVEQLDAPDAVTLARETNNYLAEAIRRHPGRIAGLAAI